MSIACDAWSVLADIYEAAGAELAAFDSGHDGVADQEPGQWQRNLAVNLTASPSA
jgi:hypothetical protein